jgi:hypothetical protein
MNDVNSPEQLRQSPDTPTHRHRWITGGVGARRGNHLHCRLALHRERQGGISIAGGLIVSQLLTLYTTPLIYVYLDRFQDWYRSRRLSAHAPPNGFQSDLMT